MISVEHVNLPNLPEDFPVTASLVFVLTLGSELIRHALTPGLCLTVGADLSKSDFSLSRDLSEGRSCVLF